MRIRFLILFTVISLVLCWPAHAQPPPAATGVFTGLGKTTVAVTYSIPLTKAPAPALSLEGIWAGGKGGAGLATTASTVVKPVAKWLHLSLDDNLVSLLDHVKGGGAALTDNWKDWSVGAYLRVDLASWNF